MTEVQYGANEQVLSYTTFPEIQDATKTLLRDAPPKPVDAIFFFGRSFFDAEKRGIFTDAADSVKSGQAKYIFLADSEGERVGETIPRTAYPGKSLWTDRLVKLGVKEGQIIYCPNPMPGERGFNTKTEAEAFLKKMNEMGLHTAAALTHPHQIVRAMLGIVKSINDTGSETDVWCMSPQSTDWNKKVRGSQGLELKPRIDHVQDEIDRIIKYQNKGDIASFEELNMYLTKRDNRQA